MTEEVYEKLCEHLDEQIIGAPKSSAFLSILKILFTPEEAALALKISALPETLSEIEARVKGEVVDAELILEAMARKGTVFKRRGKKDGCR